MKKFIGLLVIGIFLFTSIIVISANDYVTTPSYITNNVTSTFDKQYLFMNNSCDTSTVTNFGDEFTCELTIDYNNIISSNPYNGIPKSGSRLISITTLDNYTLENVSITNVDSDYQGNDIPSISGDQDLVPSTGISNSEFSSSNTTIPSTNEYGVVENSVGYDIYLTETNTTTTNSYYDGQIKMNLTFSLNELNPSIPYNDINNANVSNTGTVLNSDGTIDVNYDQTYDYTYGFRVGGKTVYQPTDFSAISFRFDNITDSSRALIETDPQISDGFANEFKAAKSAYTYVTKFPNLTNRADLLISWPGISNDEYDVFIDPSNTGDTSWTISDVKTENLTSNVIVDVSGASPVFKDVILTNPSYNIDDDGEITISVSQFVLEGLLRPGNDAIINLSGDFDTTGKQLNGYLGSGYPISYGYVDMYGNDVNIKTSKVNFYYGTQKPVLEVDDTASYDRGTSFDLSSFIQTATDGYGDDVTSQVTYESSPELKGDGTDKPGDYTVTYKLDNLEGTTIVTINDVPDQIVTFDVTPKFIEIDEGETLPETPVITATNQFGDDISGDVIVETGTFKNDGTDAPGVYIIKYTLQDQLLEVTIKVNEVKTPPVTEPTEPTDPEKTDVTPEVEVKVEKTDLNQTGYKLFGLGIVLLIVVIIVLIIIRKYLNKK